MSKRWLMRGPLMLVFAAVTAAAFAGSLDPSGPPAPTMKPLDDVEPRTPISSVPFTISTPGSYYLTRNLTTAGVAITVNAGPATIDLNGYTLNGSFGSGIGVSATSQYVTVRNGTLRDFALALSFTGGIQSLEDLLVVSCTSRAAVGDATIVRSWFGGRTQGAGTGISGPSNVVMIRDVRVNNFQTGILLGGPRDLIEDSIVDFNGGDAIMVSAGSSVRRTNVVQNNGAGITVTGSGLSLIADNNLVLNGSDGIRIGAGSGALVVNNNVSQCGGDGIEVSGSRHRIEGNNLSGNSGFGVRVPGTFNVVVRNTAGANSSGAFSITGGGNIAPIETGTVTNAVSNVSY